MCSEFARNDSPPKADGVVDEDDFFADPYAGLEGQALVDKMETDVRNLSDELVAAREREKNAKTEAEREGWHVKVCHLEDAYWAQCDGLDEVRRQMNKGRE